MVVQWQEGHLKVRLLSGTNLITAQRPVVGLRLWKGTEMPTDRDWVYSSVKKGSSPYWNESFTFNVRNADQSLEVSVSDQKSAGRQFVGQNFVYMAELEPNVTLPFNMVLMGTEQSTPASSLTLELFLSASTTPLPPSVQGIRPPEGTVPRASGRPAVWASMAPAALSSYHTGDPTHLGHGPRHSSPVGRTEIAYHAVSDPRVQVGRTLPQPRSSSPLGRLSLEGGSSVERLYAHSPGGVHTVALQSRGAVPRSYSPARAYSPARGEYYATDSEQLPVRYTSPVERGYTSDHLRGRVATYSQPGWRPSAATVPVGPLHPGYTAAGYRPVSPVMPPWAMQPPPVPQIAWHGSGGHPVEELDSRLTGHGHRRPFSPPRHGDAPRAPKTKHCSCHLCVAKRRPHEPAPSDSSSSDGGAQRWALVPYRGKAKASPPHRERHHSRHAKKNGRRRSYSSSSASDESTLPPRTPTPPRARRPSAAPARRAPAPAAPPPRRPVPVPEDIDDYGEPSPPPARQAKGAWAQRMGPAAKPRIRQRPPVEAEAESPLPLAWVHSDWREPRYAGRQTSPHPAADTDSRQRPDTSTYKSLPGPRRPAVGSHTDDRRDDLARPPPEYWGAPPDYSTPTASLQRTRPRPSSGPGPGAGPGSPPAAAPARRPVVAEVVVLGAKDMDVPNAGADFARDLFARARLGGEYQDTRPIRTFKTALWDESFHFRLPEAGPFTLMVEVFDTSRPTAPIGRCTVDMSMLPWTKMTTHNLQEPLQGGSRGSMSLMVHALSESDIRAWIQRAERWILDDRRENYFAAAYQIEAPRASPVAAPPVPLLTAPRESRRLSDGTELEEYVSRHPAGTPSLPPPPGGPTLKFALIVLRFLRGPKGFLENSGDVYLKVAATPLRTPSKVNSLTTSSQPRAGVMTWTEPLGLGLFKGPCRVDVRLITAMPLGDVPIGEAQFDLPGQAQAKRHRDFKMNAPVPGSSKRLQTELHIEYSVVG